MLKIHSSARKHYLRDRLDDESITHAVDHTLASWPLDDEDDPRRWMIIGADRAGRLVEIVMLIFDSGDSLIIHAMKARRQYRERLALD